MRAYLVLYVLFLTVFSSSQVSAQDQLPGNIYTVAGGGQANSISALLVALGQNPGAALDGQGNVYIASSDVRRVYKIDASGTATVFAGTGVAGSSGDGGPAAMAKFINPQGIALDSAGNVYIVDDLGERVRKVDTSGIITTFAGTGIQGFSGDNGPAALAQLGGPDAVAVDGAGNIYIAEFVNQRVRKVDPTGTITTFAGNGTPGFAGDNGPASSAQLNFPFGLAVDSSSNLYIADADNNRVRKVDVTGKITTFAGGGTTGLGDGGAATSAELSTPQGLAFDAAGNLFITEVTGARVRKVDTSGTITTVAGNGVRGFSGDNGLAVQAELGDPLTVAVVTTGNLAGTLYITEGINFDVRKVDTKGIVTSFAGNHFAFATGDGGPATSAQLGLTEGVAVDSLGNLFIADSTDNAIRKVDASGVIRTIAGNGQFGFGGDGGPASLAILDLPEGLAVDAAGNLLFADNFRIRRIDTSGMINTVAGNGTLGFSGDNGPATQAQIGGAFGVAVDSAGNFYIADTNNQRIRKVDTTGTITTVAGNGTAGFAGDNGPAVNAQFHTPISVAVDSASNLFVADQLNNRVRKIDTSGTITTVAGTGTPGFSGDNGPATAANLDGPDAVALDRSGNLFMTVRGRIRKVDLSGTITTVAGNGASGFSGDSGPALNAGFSAAFAGITLDSAGNLYISDSSNERIRKVINASGLTLFSLSPSASSLTVSPGGSATTTLTIAPANGFSGTVSLACAVTVNTPGSGNIPTCSVSPAQVNVGPGSPTAMLTVSAGPQAGLMRPHSGPRGFAPWGTLAMAVALGAGASGRRRRRNSRLLSLLFLACVLTGIGCGGGSGSPPLATFKVTTMATSGSASASTSINVSVQ